MAVQVSYPGVYIDEFAPGAPIEGVGTSTAGFIGTAPMGPIKTPRLVQSWDDFKREFGDFTSDPFTAGYLVPAVYGFFQNGGTAAYVVRASSGVKAFANLASRGGPNPVLIVRAVTEGPAGSAITVTVKDSSVLATVLANAMAPRKINAVTVGGTVLTLDPPGNQGFTPGDAIMLTKPAVATFITTVKSVSAGNKVTLALAIPAGNFVNGSLQFAPQLASHLAASGITGITSNADATVSVKVSSLTGFAIDDQVQLTDNAAANPVVRTVLRTEGGNSLVVADFPNAATYNGGDVRSADLVAGQTVIRLAVPLPLGIGAALPAGTVASLTLTPAVGPVVTEIVTIAAAGGDTIQLRDGLVNAYSLDDPQHLPMLATLEFDLEVNDPASPPPQTFTGLSMNPDHPNYWQSTVASTSITLETPVAPPSIAADPRPVANPYPLGGGVADNRPAAWADIIGNPDGYLALLEPVDEVALVAIPGATDQVVQQAIIAHCEKMADRFGVLDSPPGADLQAIRTHYAAVRSARGYAALYYPWVQVRNPLTRKDELWPPSGHILGSFARSDATRGVHKAPANMNVRGAFAVERRLTDQEQGPINLMGINVIRVFPEQSQPMIWGARTTATDRNWQYVNVRRLFLFLEESIEEGIRWAVFEPNNLQLWEKLKRTITAFLTQVWRDGGLFGETADKAFYVRIDEALNPFATQALGRLYIEIGVRPTYPAEFIIVRIGIWQGGSEVAET